MATLLWQRDIGSDLSSVKNTFSGWDQCMAKAYCKWPVIAGIVVGSLIVLSIVWCLARCLCCGAEVCCGCLSCCNACCPSPRNRRPKDYGGYQQAPPAPSPFYNQYQAPAPMYASAPAGYRGANVSQTATFETPSKSSRYNEDSLPAMPSWDNATTRREEVMEMDKLDREEKPATTGDGMLYQNPEPPSQHESLLGQQGNGVGYNGQRSPNSRQDFPHEGDMGNMAAQPYSDYQNPRAHQFSPGPYGAQNRASPSPYGSSFNHIASPAPTYNTEYFDPGQSQHTAYEPSVVPPSYHTRPDSEVVSPLTPGQQQTAYPGQAAYQPYNNNQQAYSSQQPYTSNADAWRKPVQGSWREV